MRWLVTVMMMVMAAGTHLAAHADPDASDDWPAGAHENIGGLALADPASNAIKLAGEPILRTKPAFQGSTGDYIAFWTFRGGISLEVAQDGPGKPFFIHVIKVGQPSKWKTVEGIGLGSTLDAVRAAFGKDLHAPDAHIAGGAWMVGNLYGGLFLTMTDDRVVGMYFGAMAF